MLLIQVEGGLSLTDFIRYFPNFCDLKNIIFPNRIAGKGGKVNALIVKKKLPRYGAVSQLTIINFILNIIKTMRFYLFFEM